MAKTLAKVTLGSIIVAVFFIIISLILAPFVVRQEQVKSFITKNVELPEGYKLKIASDINFGIFPYSFVEFAKAEITKQDGSTQTIEDFLLGFTFNDLLSKGIDFDFNAKLSGKTYQGNLKIEDFKNFRSNRKSNIILTLSSPIPASLKGFIEFNDNSKKLSNFTFVHSETTARGEVEISNLKNGNAVKGNVVINTANLDELRRLIDFENFADTQKKLAGKAVINSQFETSGNNDMEYKKNLKAQGDFNVTSAEIYGFDINEFLANPLNYKNQKDYSKKTIIDSITGVYNILDGVAGITSVNAYNQTTKLIANGNYNLLTKQIDMMSDISTNIAGQNISLPVRLEGDVNKPKVIPNVSEGLKRNLPDIINNPKLQEVINSEEGQKIINKVNKALDDAGGVDGLLQMLGGEGK
ncbi:MAG: AsmA-like C-terminal region-containing protein [Rickettsiales bacterium]|nr:AsmA-like C-terminal region-containing protein [Rickettsiales bacterium]